MPCPAGAAARNSGSEAKDRHWRGGRRGVSRRRRTAIRLAAVPVKRAARRRYTPLECDALRRTGRKPRQLKGRHHPAKAQFIRRLLAGDIEQHLNVIGEAAFLGIGESTLRRWLLLLEGRDGLKRRDNAGGRGLGLTVIIDRARLYEVLTELAAGEAELQEKRKAKAAKAAERAKAWRVQQVHWWIDRKPGHRPGFAVRPPSQNLVLQDRRQNPLASPATPFLRGDKDLLGRLLRQDFEPGTLAGGAPTNQTPPLAARGGAEIRASRVQLGPASQNHASSYPNPCPPANAIAARAKYEREQRAHSLAAGQKSQEDEADYQHWRQQRLFRADNQNSHPVTVTAQKEFERRRRADSMRELKRWQEEEAEFRRLRPQRGRLQ